MYSLTISFGPAATVWQFLFKEEEKAGVVYNAYVESKINSAVGVMLIGADDFGQSFAIPFEEIRGVLLEDLELTTESRIRRTLEQAHGQAKYTERAKNDPILRQAMNQRGPGVITPFAGGQFN